MEVRFKNCFGVYLYTAPPIIINSTKLFHSGRIYTSSSALAEILNGFFVEKISLIRKKLPNPTDDPLQMLRHLMVNRTAQFSLSPVHPDTVRKIILSLKNSKACGVDNIDTYIIKLMVDEIVPPVTHILNLSITAIDRNKG